MIVAIALAALTLAPLDLQEPGAIAPVQVPVQAPAQLALQATDRRFERVRYLQTLRGELKTMQGSPGGAQLKGLLERFSRGELDLGQLQQESALIDPRLGLKPVLERAPQDVPPKVISWTPGPAGARPRPDLDLAISRQLDDGQPRELQMMKLKDDGAFVSIADWLDVPGRYHFAQNGAPLENVEQLQGVVLEPGERVWWFDANAPTTLLPSEEPSVLCGLLVNLGAPAAGEEPDVRLLELWASFAQSPLVWQQEREAYGTEVSIGLRVAAGETRQRPLDPPIQVALASKGESVVASPRRIELSSVGGLDAQVMFDCPRHDAEDVALVTIFGGESVEHPAEIRASTAAFELVADSLFVPGFGLGEVRFSVERLAEDRLPLAGGDALVASLTADRGVLSVPEVSFAKGENRIGGLLLRSRGVGTATVTASRGRAGSNSLQVRFTWPWAILIASLVGGALGGWVRFTSDEDPGPFAGRPVARVLVGAVVALAVVLGVLTGLASYEAVPRGSAGSIGGTLVLAIAAGFVGRSLLERLAAAMGLGAEK